jgi:hypothetical protein
MAKSEAEEEIKVKTTALVASAQSSNAFRVLCSTYNKYSVIAIARPVRVAYFATFNFSTSTIGPPVEEEREAVPRRISLPKVVIGRAVPDLRLLCKTSRTLFEPLIGRELDGRANPVTGRPDCETGRTP